MDPVIVVSLMKIEEPRARQNKENKAHAGIDSILKDVRGK